MNPSAIRLVLSSNKNVHIMMPSQYVRPVSGTLVDSNRIFNLSSGRVASSKPAVVVNSSLTSVSPAAAVDPLLLARETEVREKHSLQSSVNKPIKLSTPAADTTSVLSRVPREPNEGRSACFLI